MPNNTDSVYYVYCHRRLTDNSIFYVGKGKRSRHIATYNRSKYWQNIVNKHGFVAEKLYKNLDEELAFLVEQELIDKLRKLNVVLCNITSGGDGLFGYKMTDSHKQKIALGNLNKKRSVETRKNMSKAHVGKTLPQEQKDKIAKAVKAYRQAQKNKFTKEIYSL